MIEIFGIPDCQIKDQKESPFYLNDLKGNIEKMLKENTGEENSSCVFFHRDLDQNNLGRELVFRITPLTQTPPINFLDQLAQIMEGLRKILKSFAKTNILHCRIVIGLCQSSMSFPAPLLLDGTVQVR